MSLCSLQSYPVVHVREGPLMYLHPIHCLNASIFISYNRAASLLSLNRAPASIVINLNPFFLSVADDTI